MLHLKNIPQHPVFWVIVPLAMVLIPHLPRLPVWMIILLPLLFGWRLLAIVKPRLLPGKILLFLIIFPAVIILLFHYGTLLGKTAGTALLSLLLAIKLLESTQKRDYMLLIALSFFIIVTNFLFSQTIPTVVFMLISAIVLIMSLIFINQGDAPVSFRSRLKMSSLMLVQALPMMLILFVLFPRIPGPLWSLPEDSSSPRTGLSDTMSPGSISELIQSNEIAFRVQFKSEAPAQNSLYWRALVLWYFDGKTWEHGKPNLNPTPTLEGFDTPLSYTITLEPHDKKWLFALDMPSEIPENVSYTNNFLLRSESDIHSLYQYTVSSFLDYRIEQQLSAWERSAGLKLPEGANPRTVALGQQWRRQFKQPRDIVQHALENFNQQNFFYTLQPPATPGFDPVDQFLFTTRRGFCEHYASSFTVLMRAAGIPARIVLGYQGGTQNPLNNFYSVTQSDAHAWSEVWLEQEGWVRIDPTAAIAPNRIEQNLNAALAATENRPFHMRMNSGMLKQLKFYWDAIDNSWKQWVIGYDSKLQNQLLNTIFNRDIDYVELILFLITTLAVITLIIALFIFRPFSRNSLDPIQRLYGRFCKKLARKGLIRQDYEGPLDFACRAGSEFPADKNTINLITAIYINQRYRSRENTKQLNNMKQMIKKLRLSAS